MSDEMMTLSNGHEVPAVVVPATMASLRHLLSFDPVSFYELVMLCRDSNHKLFGTAAVRLTSMGLLERNGEPHDVVRDIVLSAVTGEGLGLALGSPVADTGIEVSP